MLLNYSKAEIEEDPRGLSIIFTLKIAAFWAFLSKKRQKIKTKKVNKFERHHSLCLIYIQKISGISNMIL